MKISGVVHFASVLAHGGRRMMTPTKSASPGHIVALLRFRGRHKARPDAFDQIDPFTLDQISVRIVMALPQLLPDQSTATFPVMTPLSRIL